MADPPASYQAVTWDDLLSKCSLIHTTSMVPVGDWTGAPMRPDAKSAQILLRGEEATVIPTAMHEPGFYYWFHDTAMGSDAQLADLQAAVAAGEVFIKSDPPTSP